MRADGRTDVTEITVAFHSFADASGTLEKVQKLVCGLLRETRVSFFTYIVFVSLLRFWGARLSSFGVDYVEFQGLALRDVIVCPCRDVCTTSTVGLR